MALHLVTTVGGDGWHSLEPMLRHYRDLGVDAFHVTLLLPHEGDSAREPVNEIVRDFGCPLFDTVIGDGELWQETYTRPRRNYPRDWFILASPAELHHYSQPPADVARECERNEWECVYGGCVDRIAADGAIPEVATGSALEEQFPLGARIGRTAGQIHPQKVVLVRGAIWVAGGRIIAPYAVPCPLDIASAPIYQYRWHAAAVRSLRQRWDFLREPGDLSWRECERLLEYVDAGGGFDIADPALCVAPCSPEYPHWSDVLGEMKERLGPAIGGVGTS